MIQNALLVVQSYQISLLCSLWMSTKATHHCLHSWLLNHFIHTVNYLHSWVYQIWQLHERFGHVNVKTIIDMINDDVAWGLSTYRLSFDPTLRVYLLCRCMCVILLRHKIVNHIDNCFDIDLSCSRLNVSEAVGNVISNHRYLIALLFIGRRGFPLKVISISPPSTIVFHPASANFEIDMTLTSGL
jgi:hypothetical protein